MDIFGMRWTKTETVIIFLVAAAVLYWIGYSYYYYPFNVFLSYLAVLVAVVAALAASISLKYTRDTIRPFLSFNGTISLGGSGEERTLAFRMTNTGSMPADNIQVRIDVFGEDEKIHLKNISKKYGKFFDEEADKYPPALVLFPSENWQSVFCVNLTSEYNKELWEGLLSGNIKLRVTIQYRSFRRNHETIQTVAFDELSLSSDKKYFHGTSIEPQKWV